MTAPHRSGCPINLTLELFGDRWSLIVLRDIIFGGRRHFREILTHSLEGISSNILADRLRMLMEEGLVTRADDPTHRQKAIYSLTEKAIALIPLLAHLGAWGRRFLPVSEDLAVRAQILEEGGPPLWDRFMAELREQHLGMPCDHDGPTVIEELTAAYLEVKARQAADAEGSAPP